MMDNTKANGMTLTTVPSLIKLAMAMLVAVLLSQPAMVSADDAFPETNGDNDVVAMVNINEDSAEKMAELLSGVGVVRAEAIVEYRESNGEFTEVDDLTVVSGIGPATIDNNRHKLTVDGSN